MIPHVKLFKLPGGSIPKRETSGAIGYDVRLRAVVSTGDMEPTNDRLRKALFDFIKIPECPEVARHVVMKEGKLVYRMDPGESVLVGIGFVTEMKFPGFYWVAPRSGLASKYGITVTNAPGTVDPDYRGEAGVLVYNRNNHTFDLEHNMRIAQIIFTEAMIPTFEEVGSYTDLSGTDRGAGGFGSTGLT
jgi:dUTP pyrophosphatase